MSSPSDRRGPFLGRPWSFWRAAVAAGLACGAISLATTPPEWSITNPGVLPLWMLAAALGLAGPPRQLERHGTRDICVLVLAILGLSWPILQALGLCIEKNASLLAVPFVALSAGALLLGWRLRQQDPDLPLLALGAIGIARIAMILAGGNIVGAEVYWWSVVLAWIIGVRVLAPVLHRRAADSVPLIGVVAWFVLMVGTMTAVEYRNPHVEFVPRDDRAAMQALRTAPVGGQGFGGFERAMRQHSLRPPSLAPFQSRGVLRLAVEVGVLPLACLGFALLLSLVYTVTERPVDRARAGAMGAGALLLIAVLSLRAPVVGLLPALALAWPAALGRAAMPERMPNEDFVPSPSWIPMGASLGLLVVIGILFPTARWHYERQDPLRELGARSFLGNWAQPYRDQSWVIRARSAEISRGADPRVMLRREAEQWIRVEPRDPFAQFEIVRWAESALPVERAERIALRAHGQLPWSQEIAAFVVRLRIDDGRSPEALEWLERYGAQYGPLAPVLRARLEELQQQVRRP